VFKRFSKKGDHGVLRRAIGRIALFELSHSGTCASGESLITIAAPGAEQLIPRF
jgi:hypothetical protein